MKETERIKWGGFLPAEGSFRSNNSIKFTSCNTVVIHGSLVCSDDGSREDLDDNLRRGHIMVTD